MNGSIFRAFVKEAAALASAPPKPVLEEGQRQLQKQVKKERVEDRKDMLRKFDKARPYVHRGLVGSIPGGWVAGFMKKDPLPKHRMAGMAAAGALAVGDKHMEELSKKREFRSVLKSYREKDAASLNMGSVDMRRGTGIRKPPFATKGSKSLQMSSLRAENKKLSDPGAGPTALQQSTLV